MTEGGSLTLTSQQVRVVLDYEKYGVRESGVLLHVARPAQHGRLFSTLWRRAGDATFTLLDVHADRVRYVHDGSETRNDSALLELELAPRYRAVVAMGACPPLTSLIGCGAGRVSCCLRICSDASD